MTATPAHWSRNLRAWYDEALKSAHTELGKRIGMRFEEIRWQVTGRASRKAGVCWPAQKRIWLHAAMTEEQAKSTFAHELAHLWVCWFNGPSMEPCHHHDAAWRKWAQALGDEGDRCHNYAEVLATKRGDWAHCACNEYKKVWRSGDPTTYRCRKCNTFLRPGKRTPVQVVAQIMQPTVVKVCAQVSADPSESVGVKIRSLALELGMLREGGLASSPEAKKIRVMLRKLDPEWRTR